MKSGPSQHYTEPGQVKGVLKVSSYAKLNKAINTVEDPIFLKCSKLPSC